MTEVETEADMDMPPFEMPDPILTNKIVTELKSQGIFDDFRRECMADVDTKPAYQNLRQRVEASVKAFLKTNPWKPDMNKNQLRESLRKHLQRGSFLDIGVDRIVDQVVNPKIYTIFLPKVEQVVYNCMGDDNEVRIPSPQPEPKPEQSRFQSKHNLAPRAVLSGPRVSSYLMPDIMDSPGWKSPPDDDISLAEKHPHSGVNPVKSRVNISDDDDDDDDEDDDDDDDDDEDEDDEESPAFEPNSESDRLILGVRTDSSDSTSDEGQVVTTIVDDNLEERIDNDTVKDNTDEIIAAEREEKDKGYDSDVSLPKTPTLMEEECESELPDFQSYENKYNEQSEDIDQEAIPHQWTDEKSERSSYDEDSIGTPNKKKRGFPYFEEKSSSSFINSSCDEERFDSENYLMQQEKMRTTPSNNQETFNDHLLNEDWDKSFVDPVEGQCQHSITPEHKNVGKGSNSSSSGDKHHSYRDSSGRHKSRSKIRYSLKDEQFASFTKDEPDYKKENIEYHSKDESIDEEGMDMSSPHKYNNRECKSMSSENYKSCNLIDELRDTNNRDIEIGKDKNNESRRGHSNKSRHSGEHDKNKSDSRSKHSSIKKGHDSHKHRDGAKSSRHSHGSKHSHSSNEHRRSDKHHRHGDLSKNKTDEKITDKYAKSDSPKKKFRGQCKPSDKDYEERRSNDGDGNDPSRRGHSSSSSIYKSSSPSNNTDTSFSSEKASNSDNTVSENVEPTNVNMSVVDSSFQQGIASPDIDLFAEPDAYERNMHCKIIEEDREPVEDINENNLTSNLFASTKDNNKNIVKDINNVLDDSKNQDSIIVENYQVSGKSIVVETRERNLCDDEVSDEQSGSIQPFVNDTSSEKENIDVDDNMNLDLSDNINSALCGNRINTFTKFKKPKIAANIFEVRKIMRERRNAERMEKKRMKLLMKTKAQLNRKNQENSKIEECDITISHYQQGQDTSKTENLEKSNSQDHSNQDISKKVELDVTNNEDNQNQVTSKMEELDLFLGFDETLTNKLDVYARLINRLTNESTEMRNDFKFNPVLITQIISTYPDLDEYVETIVKQKINNKIQVRVPPVCPEFFEYDKEQNVYILTKYPEDFFINILNNTCLKPPGDSGNKCSNIIQGSEVGSSKKTRGTKNPNNILQTSIGDSEIIESSEPDVKEASLQNSSENVNISPVSLSTTANAGTTDLTPPSPITFSLTFNRTYEDILKEKDVGPIDEEKVNSGTVLNKAGAITKALGRTVVKITSNMATEEVIIKPVGFKEIQVPKITRTESSVNRKLPKSPPSLKRMPLISRVSKSSNNNVVLAPSSSDEMQRANGLASLHTDHLEADVALPESVSPKTASTETINDTIITNEGAAEHRFLGAVTSTRQKTDSKTDRLRKQQQCYSSSDLYKPRPQLTSRRVRGHISSPAEIPAPAVITRKRTCMTVVLAPDAAEIPAPAVITRKRACMTAVVAPVAAKRKR